jgi:hypothetical protein
MAERKRTAVTLHSGADMWHARCGELEAVGPAAGGVVDARDLDFSTACAVGDDVRRFRYCEFTRTGDDATLLESFVDSKRV